MLVLAGIRKVTKQRIKSSKYLADAHIRKLEW